MKKVLVITYYWPPSGGSGVQRWLKLCKFLPEFGWEPIVYTPENPDVDIVDPSLADDVRDSQIVIRQPIVEPRRLFARLSGRKGQEDRSVDQIVFRDAAQRNWMQKAAIWARGNLFVPDARMLWVRPSTRFLSEYLKSNPVDAVVTTAPPQSMHLVGLRLKRKFGLPWLADFRDPWTGILYFDKLYLSSWAKKRHRSMERSVLEEADVVISVSPTLTARDRQMTAGRVATITNGYDPDDFSGEAPPRPDHFTLCHAGFLSDNINYPVIWQALSEMKEEIPDLSRELRIRLVGNVDAHVVETIARHRLGDQLDLTGYLPHAESIRHIRSASALLLFISRRSPLDPGIITGKLFEYLAARRPILLIGPTDGDAAQIVRDTGAGSVYDPTDLHGIQGVIRGWYRDYREASLDVADADISRFSRRNQAHDVVKLLDSVLSSRP